MSTVYSNSCQHCGNNYKGYGKSFCSNLCKNRARIGDKDWLKKLSVGSKRNWQKDEFRLKMKKRKHVWLGRKHSLESRAKMSGSLKKRYATGLLPWNKGIARSEKTKEKISRANKGKLAKERNPQWSGGISKSSYDPLLTKYKRYKICKRDDFKCQNDIGCKKSKKLTVHHIDYDKQNSNENNLITLCHSCNCRANFKREYWQKYYQNKFIYDNNRSHIGDH